MIKVYFSPWQFLKKKKKFQLKQPKSMEMCLFSITLLQITASWCYDVSFNINCGAFTDLLQIRELSLLWIFLSLLPAVCLRIQINPQNKGDFLSISPERAFADFLFAHTVLHLVVINFIGWETSCSTCSPTHPKGVYLTSLSQRGNSNPLLKFSSSIYV